MAFTALPAVTAGATAARASWAERARTNFDDHESRLLVVEGATVGILTADPGSPADDTWWVVRDGGSPQAVAIKVRIGGTTYTLAEITI